MSAFFNKVRDKLLDMALGSKPFLAIVAALWAGATALAHKFLTTPLTLPAPWGAVAAGYTVAVTAVACWLVIRVILTSRKLTGITIVDTDLNIEWKLHGAIDWWLRVDPTNLSSEVFRPDLTGPFCATKGCGTVATVRWKRQADDSVRIRAFCMRCSRNENPSEFEEVDNGYVESMTLMELQRQYRLHGKVKGRMIIGSHSFTTAGAKPPTSAA